ncbi:hypothetical protein [Sphingobacterium cellulitidis]|uniref:hypothetical protein n=1 Tax=Sphingobacterium cellulitidis TaxID=1768011 RepID=UPI000B941DA5|nr:hypothetical protein CHT99_02535 [Sphingobacterium cellulitidis]
MFKISLLFFVAGVLVLAFAVFVPSKDSSITINFYDTYYVLSSISLFKFLGLLGLIFSGLYYFTEQKLYSKTWSIMHLISFICLIVNVWTWGFVERVYFGNFEADVSSRLPNAEQAERIIKIQQFYVGTFLLMVFLQLLYVLNLVVGMIYKKSNTEEE